MSDAVIGAAPVAGLVVGRAKVGCVSCGVAFVAGRLVEPPQTPGPAEVQAVGRDITELKQAEEAAFIDLIACERDCRNCSYAAALDCDGNCGVCPHNIYCPCVNPVVARSKSALRLIELRPILLQDVRGRD